MLNSFRNLAYLSSYLDIKNFERKKDYPNVKKLTMAILESSYRVLQVTSKWETLKNLPIFDLLWHLNKHNFDYILGKVAKLHFLESQQKSLKTR